MSIGARLSRLLGHTASDAVLTLAETTVLDAVMNALRADGAACLRSQLAVINHVQRDAVSFEVSFYAMKWGRARFDDAIRFPRRRAEEKLATVVLEEPGVGDLSVDVWLANGRVFSLVFSRKQDVKGESTPTVRSVQLHCDPMQVPLLPSTPAEEASVRNWLSPELADVSIGDLMPAVDVDEGKAVVVPLDRYPADAQVLFRITDGFRIGRWRVTGPGSARCVVISGDEIVVLAESDGGRIIGLNSHQRPELLLLEHDAPVRGVGNSFKRALYTELQKADDEDDAPDRDASS